MDKEKQRIRFGMTACVILFMAVIFLLQGIDTQAAVSKKEKYGTFVGKKPGTYTVSGNTVYFYPKKIYYSGNKIVCNVYVVNRTGHKIEALSNVKLTLLDKKGSKVAQHTFKAKKSIVIKKNKYKTLQYVFPKSSVKKQSFNFGKAKKMTIKASFTYYRP